MLQNFLTVGQQVLVLFLLIGIGFVCGKTQLFGERTAKGMANLVLTVATPCMIVQSFQYEMQAKLLRDLLLAMLFAAVLHIVMIGVANVLFREKEEARRRVLKFAMVFSNAGYMALPLQEAVLGAEGVFYGAAYIAVFNITLWSWGLWEMSGDKKSLTAKKLIINPGLIGVAVGFGLFITSFHLPAVLEAPVRNLAALNTPLPMLIIGYHLSKSDVFKALRDRRALLAIGFRNVVLPLAALGVTYLCGMRGTLLVSCTIAASAPVAAATSMFAAKYDRDVELSVNLVSLSTLFSVISMPLIVGLAKTLP